MNVKNFSTAFIAAATVLVAATPQSANAKRIVIAGHNTTIGKYGPLTPNDLQGAYQMVEEHRWDDKTKKWQRIPTVGVWSINLTQTAPGHYLFPGFKDVLHGSNRSISGFLTDPGMAVTAGGKKPKPKKTAVRFVIKDVMLYEYQESPTVPRFTFKKVADNPSAWNQIK